MVNRFLVLPILSLTLSLGLIGCKSAPPCGSCQTIKANQENMQDYINDVAEWFDEATYHPGTNPSDPGEIEFKNQNLITNTLGSALKISINGATQNGAQIAQRWASTKVTCTAEEICDHGKCPKEPKIWFSCGESTCGESQSTSECDGKVRACLLAMMEGAINSRGTGKIYSKDKVETAMNKSFENSQDCASIKLLHIKCEKLEESSSSTSQQVSPKLCEIQEQPEGDSIFGDLLLGLELDEATTTADPAAQ